MKRNAKNFPMRLARISRGGFARGGFAGGLARAGQGGFTLIEIILVVVIILTLVGLVGPRIAGRGKENKVNTTKIQMGNLETMITEFEINAGRVPTNEEGLDALVKKPSGLGDDEWKGPYTGKNKVPTDGWKEAYVYHYPSEHGGNYDLISKGPDRQLGTPDDLANFEEEKK